MLSLVLIGYFGYRAHVLHCAFQPSVNARVLLRHASSMCLSTSFARAPSIAQELAFAHDSNVHKLLCTYSAGCLFFYNPLEHSLTMIPAVCSP